jgi:hypothetical protein
MQDYELKTNKVYQIKTIQDIFEDGKIKKQKGQIVTAKWQTCFFEDDYNNKYYLGEIEIIRELK